MLLYFNQVAFDGGPRPANDRIHSQISTAVLY